MKEEADSIQWTINYLVSKWGIMKEIPEIIIGLPLLSWFVTKLYYKSRIESKAGLLEDREKDVESLEKKIEELEKDKIALPLQESLKDRVSILAADISGFLAEREASYVFKSINFEKETVALYTNKLSSRVIKIHNELLITGITDTVLNKYHNNCKTAEDIVAIEKSLRVLADKLH